MKLGLTSFSTDSLDFRAVFLLPECFLLYRQSMQFLCATFVQNDIDPKRAELQVLFEQSPVI